MFCGDIVMTGHSGEKMWRLMSFVQAGSWLIALLQTCNPYVYHVPLLGLGVVDLPYWNFAVHLEGGLVP